MRACSPALLLVLLLPAAGCSLVRVGLGGEGSADGGGIEEQDARADAAGLDASAVDAAGVDAAAEDAGDVDSTVPALDAGTDERDAGIDGGRYETHVRECEDGTLVGGMMRGIDVTASGNAYAHTLPVGPPWTTDSASLPPDRVDHALTIATPGTFYLWVRFWTVDAGHDAQYAGFSPADLRRFFHNTSFGEWVWVSPPNLRFDGVTPGPRTLSIGPGENGPRCDRIVLTNDPGFDPSTLP